MLADVRIIIHTDKGDIEGTLQPSKAPITVANFLNLARRKFYDGLVFHRVVPRFVIQGGDPMGTGGGDPGYRFENETNASLSHQQVGVIAMANAGPNTNGSQFYITIDALHRGQVEMLDEGYTMFGVVTKGLEVAQKIQKGDRITSVEILDSADEVFTSQKERLAKWNPILDKKFGRRLSPAPVIP
ncbi:MAG TPA: peptidylprolyl isomerase [Chthoniobacterales bacterium]